MIQLFLILIVGWVGHKTKVFPAETQTALTKLVVYITTPCTILYSVLNNSSLPGIGISIAKQPLREMLGSAKIYLMSALRLIVLPVLIWFVLHFFLHDQTILGVIVITFAMPTATMVSMLADEYGSDQRATVQGVFLTTLFSMVTIPLLMAALMAG